jgi:hypothetical protein
MVDGQIDIYVVPMSRVAPDHDHRSEHAELVLLQAPTCLVLLARTLSLQFGAAKRR